MTHRHLFVVVLIFTWALFAFTECTHGKESDQPVKRARPPKWTPDVLDAFFEDAREKLVGTRPDYKAAAKATANIPATEVEPSIAASDSKWSKLIDAEVIETEIKRLAAQVSQAAATPSAFKGGTYEDCRRLFSELALLFAVMADYDGEVRWRDSAPALRDVFARAGRNCKVGTDQTFNESKQRIQDLADLIAGSRPKLPQPDNDSQWAQVADRPPLMQRLNIAHEDRLRKWVASEGEFQKHHDDVRHEAQLVATIADVIGREGYDYSEDEEYATHARSLREAATEISSAVDLDNFEQAQKAVNRATKSCVDCHELYRG
jgi:hypothetical protein